MLQPESPVHISGTFNANVLGVHAALNALEVIRRDGGAVHRRLFALGRILANGIDAAICLHRVRARLQSFGSVSRFADNAGAAHPTERPEAVFAANPHAERQWTLPPRSLDYRGPSNRGMDRSGTYKSQGDPRFQNQAQWFFGRRRIWPAVQP
jgi:hypothetical protein